MAKVRTGSCVPARRSMCMIRGSNALYPISELEKRKHRLQRSVPGQLGTVRSTRGRLLSAILFSAPQLLRYGVYWIISAENAKVIKSDELLVNPHVVRADTRIQDARNCEGAGLTWKAATAHSSAAYEQGDLLLGHPDFAHTKWISGCNNTSHGTREHHSPRNSQGKRGGRSWSSLLVQYQPFGAWSRQACKSSHLQDWTSF